jgi:hypothetical protein
LWKSFVKKLGRLSVNTPRESVIRRAASVAIPQQGLRIRHGVPTERAYAAFSGRVEILLLSTSQVNGSGAVTGWTFPVAVPILFCRPD